MLNEHVNCIIITTPKPQSNSSYTSSLNDYVYSGGSSSSSSSYYSENDTSSSYVYTPPVPPRRNYSKMNPKNPKVTTNIAKLSWKIDPLEEYVKKNKKKNLSVISKPFNADKYLQKLISSSDLISTKYVTDRMSFYGGYLPIDEHTTEVFYYAENGNTDIVKFEVVSKSVKERKNVTGMFNAIKDTYTPSLDDVLSGSLEGLMKNIGGKAILDTCKTSYIGNVLNAFDLQHNLSKSDYIDSKIKGYDNSKNIPIVMHAETSSYSNCDGSTDKTKWYPFN